jgi:hypothetical protein
MANNLVLTKALHTVTVVTRVAHALHARAVGIGNPPTAAHYTAAALDVLGYSDEARDVRKLAEDKLPELLQKCVKAVRRALEGGK